jgi:high affinity sulfate transporter 1
MIRNPSLDAVSFRSGSRARAPLRPDLVAGVTLAAYLVPAGIADASLAGLPPETGLYACLFGGLVFWALCSSRHTAITVTSAISLLVGTSVGELSGGDPVRHLALSMGAALLVGVMGLIAWAARAGVIVNFVSETVLVGFKCGIAFVLASTQLPKLLGFAGGHGSFWERLAHIGRHITDTHPVSLALGFTALAVLLAGKKLLPARPVALAVVILGVAATSIFELPARGVKVLGTVPQGLPPIGLPSLSLGEFDGIVPIALACFLLAAVESAAIGRMFALKHGYRFDPNRELLALGASNLAAGFGHGFPISGGMSQSLVNESAGARSSRSGLVAAVILLAVIVWFSGLLRDLPQPVLAAIVLAAVTGLIKVNTLTRLWRFNRGEFAIAAVAFFGVLGQGILRGIFLGVILSLVMLLRRASHPNVAELGRIGDSEVFGNLADDERRQPASGAVVARVDGALLYFNADHVRDELLERLANRPDAKVLVLFLGTVPTVDMAGADMLIELQHAMAGRGIELRFAGPHGAVRHALSRAGMDPSRVHAYRTIPEALRA